MFCSALTCVTQCRLEQEGCVESGGDELPVVSMILDTSMRVDEQVQRLVMLLYVLHASLIWCYHHTFLLRL